MPTKQSNHIHISHSPKNQTDNPGYLNRNTYAKETMQLHYQYFNSTKQQKANIYIPTRRKWKIGYYTRGEWDGWQRS